MRYILIFAMLLFAETANAQQVVLLCTQSGTGTYTNCINVSSTAPLPVYLPTGH